MRISNTRRRKAISPVLATVILIAITLIAAIAIAGFVFGLFGSFTSSAQVSSISVNLNHVIWTAGACTGAPLCTVIVANQGSANVNANSITLTYGGVTCTPTVGALPLPIPATGAQTSLTITALGTCLAGVSGQAFSGQVQLANGGQVPFSGTFS